MASALSATVCSASSTSVFDTERIASRSLISSRPMISALAAYSSSAMGPPGSQFSQSRGRSAVITHIIDDGAGASEGITCEVGHRWAGRCLSVVGKAVKAPAGRGLGRLLALSGGTHAGVKSALRRPAAALDPGQPRHPSIAVARRLAGGKYVLPGVLA